MADVEPISDQEILFRRIPVSTGWYDPSRTPPLEPEAFRANRNDLAGISLSRAKYKTVEQAAEGRPGKSYYVAAFRAGDIRAAGMHVVASPTPADASHAEIANLTYDSRKSKQAVEWRALLAEKLPRVRSVIENRMLGGYKTPPIRKAARRPPRRTAEMRERGLPRWRFPQKNSSALGWRRLDRHTTFVLVGDGQGRWSLGSQTLR
jgi:hypothetical protein